MFLGNHYEKHSIRPKVNIYDSLSYPTAKSEIELLDMSADFHCSLA